MVETVTYRFFCKVYATFISIYHKHYEMQSIYLCNATRKYVGVYCEMRDEQRVGGFFILKYGILKLGNRIMIVYDDYIHLADKDSFAMGPHLWYARHRGHTIPRSPRAKRTLLYWRPYRDHFVKCPDFFRNHTTFCLNNISTLTKKPHLWSPTNNLK